MRKSLIFMIIILFVYGCGKAKSEVPIKQNDEAEKTVPYFAMISKGWQHQFWQSVKSGAFKAAKEYNVKITFEGPEGDFAIAQQKRMIEEAIKKTPNAIIIAATNSKEVLPDLKNAQKLKIPIIAFDSGVDSDIAITTVATDNRKAAALAADKLAEAIGKTGEVAVICHDEVSFTGLNRKDGFVNEITEKYPNIKIVSVKYGSGDHEITYNLVREMLKKYPDLKGIFATNEGSAIGMINAVVAEKKEKDVVMVGFDSGIQQKEAIKLGIMLGAVSQDPVMIGYKAVEAAYLNYKGKTLPKETMTNYFWYDINNVDNLELSASLYD